jgi:hypothetical protein
VPHSDYCPHSNNQNNWCPTLITVPTLITRITLLTLIALITLITLRTLIALITLITLIALIALITLITLIALIALITLSARAVRLPCDASWAAAAKRCSVSCAARSCCCLQVSVCVVCVAGVNVTQLLLPASERVCGVCCRGECHAAAAACK